MWTQNKMMTVTNQSVALLPYFAPLANAQIINNKLNYIAFSKLFASTIQKIYNCGKFNH